MGRDDSYLMAAPPLVVVVVGLLKMEDLTRRHGTKRRNNRPLFLVVRR